MAAPIARASANRHTQRQGVIVREIIDFTARLDAKPKADVTIEGIFEFVHRYGMLEDPDRPAVLRRDGGYGNARGFELIAEDEQRREQFGGDRASIRARAPRLHFGKLNL